MAVSVAGRAGLAEGAHSGPTAVTAPGALRRTLIGCGLLWLISHHAALASWSSSWSAGSSRMLSR
jgi:hypothetical protein